MQAIILAAGMGNRLGKYTADNTKCMLPINGKTLIERALDALDAAGIRKCVMVVGYKKDNLSAFVGRKYKNLSITYVANDIYDKTNNIYSLYLAKDFLVQDDTLLLESDLIFEKNLIADMLEDPNPSVAAVAQYERWMDGTVVQIAEDKVIANFIPKKFFNYDERASYYKTVNIYKFSKGFSQNTYVPFLEAYCKTMGPNEYYEEVLRVIARLDKQELKAFILSGQKWYEIDDVQDKVIAETIFSESPQDKLTKIQHCYGGYWRFPNILDFCYLVNPYFPQKQMLKELQASFGDLLAAYPSGLDTENLLMGKLFSIEPSNILVGNGAAELIKALSPELQGNTAIFYPTFNEYPANLPPENIVALNSLDPAAQKLDMKACANLLLINPDNPSGAYVPKAEVLAALESTKNTGKHLILDESFIDFVDQEAEPSLMKQELLEKYPHLIVIKSLSKSYGVPGLRLGALACGDRDLIARVRKNLGIWNINSFAEYFLQIIGKYLKDYKSACRKLAEERQRFFEELHHIKWLEVFPSQANYFMARVQGLKARELAEQLLWKDDIFIKDLTGKGGIPDESYIRIAVRAPADNAKLIKLLASI